MVGKNLIVHQYIELKSAEHVSQQIRKAASAALPNVTRIGCVLSENVMYVQMWNVKWELKFHKNLQNYFYIFTAQNTTRSNHCIILLSSWWWA